MCEVCQAGRRRGGEFLALVGGDVRDTVDGERCGGTKSGWRFFVVAQNRRIKVMADYILRQITWRHQRYFMMRSRRRMDALRLLRDSGRDRGEARFGASALVLRRDRDRWGHI